MQFLWFVMGANGSVTMKMRGNPSDWSEAVQANLILAIADLVEEIRGEEIIEYEVDAEADNVIHLNLTKVKS